MLKSTIPGSGIQPVRLVDCAAPIRRTKLPVPALRSSTGAPKCQRVHIGGAEQEGGSGKAGGAIVLRGENIMAFVAECPRDGEGPCRATGSKGRQRL